MLNSHRPRLAVRLVAQRRDLAGVDQRVLDAVVPQGLDRSVCGEALGDPIERHGCARTAQPNLGRQDFHTPPVDFRARASTAVGSGRRLAFLASAYTSHNGWTVTSNAPPLASDILWAPCNTSTRYGCGSCNYPRD